MNGRVTMRDAMMVHHLVARLQPVRSAEVALYLGTSQQVARRRLRTLRELGYVAPIERAAPSDPYLWNLGRSVRAQEHLARIFDVDPDVAYQPRRTAPKNLDHHLRIAGFWIKMNRAIARSTKVELVEDHLDSELERRDGAQVPDAIFVLDHASQGRVALVVEIDNDTITPHRIITKLRGYAARVDAQESVAGSASWRVLFECRTGRRRNRLFMRAVEEDLPKGLVLYGVEGEVSEGNILTSSAWLTEARDLRDGEEIARLVPVNPITGVAASPIDKVYRP